jgi:hypothetical protein
MKYTYPIFVRSRNSYSRLVCAFGDRTTGEAFCKSLNTPSHTGYMGTWMEVGTELKIHEKLIDLTKDEPYFKEGFEGKLFTPVFEKRENGKRLLNGFKEKDHAEQFVTLLNIESPAFAGSLIYVFKTIEESFEAANKKEISI